MSNEDEQAAKITLKFKTTQTTHEVELPEDITVEKTKEFLAAKLDHPKERLTLIFSGKILKDPDTITSYGIKDGMAVHMVLRAGSNQPTASTPASTASSATDPSSAPTTTQASPLAGLFGSGANAAGIQNQAQQLLNNPEALREIMNQPLMQNMFSNPEIMSRLIGDNPQIQNIIQRNPELGHVLRDPDVIRQTMEMIRNPTMFNEMMRNHDQAIRNLQGIPGGEAALQRLYQDVQEPLLNSTVGSLSGNPFASSGSDQETAASRSQRAGVENAEALPNPWSSNSGQQQQRATGGSNNDQQQNPLGNLFSGLGGGGGGNMFSPEMLNALGANSQMQNLMQNVNPASLFNPRVMQAIADIQRATQVIAQEAPDLATAMGLPRGFMNAPSTGTNPASNPPTTTSATGNRPGAADFASMLQQMNLGAGGQAAAGAQLAPPEERFRSQLEQLVGMGFTDNEANIRALTATFGDVSGAIERLLGNGQP